MPLPDYNEVLPNMKAFLHQCPLVTLIAASAAAVAISLGVQTMIPAAALSSEISSLPAVSDVSSSMHAAAPASLPEPPSAVSSDPASSVPPASSAASKPAPSSAPASSAASRAAVSSAPKMPLLPESKLFGPVERSYFDDALFIGDSLTEDLKKYGGLDNASYFCRVGLNIYELFEHPKTSALSGLTLEQTLRAKPYQKIYIMLGINELGTGTTKYFVRHYSSALATIRELQPNAVLYVQSILPVAAEKSESDPVFKNSAIRERNAGLQTLDNGKNIFFLNVAPSVSNKNGDLCDGYSGDDVHLKAKYYPLWTKCLLANGVPYKDVVFS